MADAQDVGVLLVRLLWWMVATVYYMIESLVLLLVPRSYRRKDVRGDVVLITGGGSGIGRVMCLRMAAKGAIVVTWDVLEADNEETARQVRAAGSQCYAYTVDLCDREAVYTTAAKVKQDVGKVDILVNNAGIVTGKNLLECPDNDIARTFDVNTISHFWTTKVFLGDMIAQKKGHIVSIASMAGKVGSHKLTDYCASKFGAVGFMEALRGDLKACNNDFVKTTCVCPIAITTALFAGAGSKFFPPMELNWAVDEMVDAILMNVTTLYLPAYMWTIPALAALLPQKSSDHLAEITGVPDIMKNFVGKTKAD